MIHFDTSVLIKRYDLNESGAETVRSTCAPSTGNQIVLSALATVEIASAFGRKIREGVFDSQTGASRWAQFQQHWSREYQVLVCNQPISDRAEQLVFEYPLRAIDAIHLATALEHAPLLGDETLEFWTADGRQARAAEAEGLAVTLVA
jgi:uncharacterized protein